MSNFADSTAEDDNDANIHANNNAAFMDSCISGQLDRVQWLYSLGDIV